MHHPLFTLQKDQPFVLDVFLIVHILCLFRFSSAALPRAVSGYVILVTEVKWEFLAVPSNFVLSIYLGDIIFQVLNYYLT